MDHALNSSVEINLYKPVIFDQLVENNDIFKQWVIKDSLITGAGEEHITWFYYSLDGILVIEVIRELNKFVEKLDIEAFLITWKWEN